jgi:predicted secreted protein
MSTISGGEVRIFLSTDGSVYKLFASETDCTYEMNAETREVTSKDAAVFRNYVTSAKTWSVSGTMLMTGEDNTVWTPGDLYEMVGDLVHIRITTVAAGGAIPLAGEPKIQGQAILTQLSVSAPDKDNGSVSFSLNGTGSFTVGTN